MLRHANHPVASLRGRLNFIDYAGAPVWQNLLLVRYRSRRDFFEVFTDPETAKAIHTKFVFFDRYQAWPTWTTFNLIGIRSAMALTLLLLGFALHWLLRWRTRSNPSEP